MAVTATSTLPIGTCPFLRIQFLLVVVNQDDLMAHVRKTWSCHQSYVSHPTIANGHQISPCESLYFQRKK